MRRGQESRAAFTLTELLVTIGVIAILAGLTVPAISGARKRAEMIAGASHLRNLLVVIDAKAQVNQSTWPTVFSPDDPIANLTFGHTGMYSDHVLTQTVMWAPAVASGRLMELSPEVHATLVTPRLQRELVESAWPDDPALNNPQLGAGLSYLYSPALFTRPDLWDPRHPEHRDRPDDFRARVPVSSVRNPSGKASLFERADHYNTGARIGVDAEYTQATAWHVGACDGSVRRIGPSSLTPALPVEWVVDCDRNLPESLPCGTTENGYLGRDIR